MKTLKINLVAVVALMVGMVTMSFQANKSSQGYDWYAVDESGNIPSAIPLPGEPNEPECNAENSESLCAIEIRLNPNENFPQTVAEAKADHQTRGETMRDE